MHDPESGGRRRSIQEPPAPRKSKPPKPTIKELQREIVAEQTAQARTFKAVAFPYADEAREAYRQREKELLTQYKQNPGKCPICSKPIGRGVIGHISKCLRLQNSSSG